MSIENLSSMFPTRLDTTKKSIEARSVKLLSYRCIGIKCIKLLRHAKRCRLDYAYAQTVFFCTCVFVAFIRDPNGIPSFYSVVMEFHH